MSKQICVMSIGGSASEVLNLFAHNSNIHNNIFSLAIDTDKKSLDNLDEKINRICLTNAETIENVIDRVGIKNIESWFIQEEVIRRQGFIKMLRMDNGVHMWRQLALLAFIDYLANSECCEEFHNLLDIILSKNIDEEVDYYILTSTCGGTGSGLFLPVSLYISKYAKEKYNLDVKFKLILMCADIYNETSQNDNSIKRYANSYACMSELNAINLVTNGYNQNAQKEYHSEINFKISLKEDVLFDSLDDAYANRDYFPFKKIYLFDKIPSVVLIKNHESILATLLNFIISDESIDVITNVENIYSGLTISRIVYPFDDNINYLTHRLILDEINTEWLFISKFIGRIDRGLSPRKLVSKINDALNLIISNNEDNLNLDEVLLNRKYAEDVLGIVIKYELGKETTTSDKISEAFIKVVKNYCKSIDCSKINKVLDEDVELEKIKLFDSKKVRKEKQDNFEQKTQVIFDELKKFYNEKLREFKSNEKNFLSDTIKDVVEQIFIDEHGSFIHPIIALYRLVNIYLNLNKKYDEMHLVNYSYFTQLGDISLPTDLLDLSNEFETNEDNDTDNDKEVINVKGNQQSKEEKIASKYLDLGDNRVNLLLNSSTNDLVDLPTEYQYFIKDIKQVIDNIKIIINEYYVRSICDYLVDMIVSYSEVFSRIRYASETLEDEVLRLKRVGIYNSFYTTNIFASVDNKEELYSQLKESITEYGQNDGVLGKLFYNKILKEKVEINRNIVSKIIEDYSKVIENDVDNNKIINALKEYNIIEVLEKDSTLNGEIDFLKLRKKCSTILNSNYTPLVIKEIYGDDINAPIKKQSIILSSSIADYIVNNATRYNLNSTLSDEVVVEFFNKIGSNTDIIEINNNFSNKELYVTNKIDQMSITYFNKLDECNSEFTYYNYYLKALNKAQDTIQWNPYLFNYWNNNCYLPSINIKNDVLINKKLIKTMLVMFLEKRVVTNYFDKIDEVIYFTYINEKLTPILFNDDFIYQNDLNKLLDYFRLNRELLEEESQKFDKYIVRKCYELSIYDGNVKFLDKLIDEIFSMEFISVLKKDILSKLDFATNLDYLKMIITAIIDTGILMFKSRGFSTKYDVKVIVDYVEEFILEEVLKNNKDKLQKQEIKKYISVNYR